MYRGRDWVRGRSAHGCERDPQLDERHSNLEGGGKGEATQIQGIAGCEDDEVPKERGGVVAEAIEVAEDGEGTGGIGGDIEGGCVSSESETPIAEAVTEGGGLNEGHHRRGDDEIAFSCA